MSTDADTVQTNQLALPRFGGQVLVYNVGSSAALADAGLGCGLHGPALWPAIPLPAAMVFCCIAGLLRGHRSL